MTLRADIQKVLENSSRKWNAYSLSKRLGVPVLDDFEEKGLLIDVKRENAKIQHPQTYLKPANNHLTAYFGSPANQNSVIH